MLLNMENSKYKTIVENGPVEMEQMGIIHIPSTLHSDDANHIVTTTDELYDILLKKRQYQINQEVHSNIEAIFLAISSGSGDIEEIKNFLKNYITREEYEEIVSELRTSIKESEENSNKYTDDKLTDYYTKKEVDDKFLELEIEKILNGVTTSLSITPSGVFETNVETDITVKYNVNNFTLSDKSVLSLTIKKGNDIVATGTGETISYSDKISKTTSYSATCVYNNGVKSWSSSASKNSYHRTYYGFGFDEEDIFTNGHSKVTSSAKGTYSDVSNTDNVYYYIIVPSGVSCPSIFTMNATPFVMNKSSLTKNNITYTVLKSGSVFGIGGEVSINAQ